MSDHRTLVVWQMADAVVKQVFGLLERRPLRSYFVIRDQLGRCALSVPCNIVEGYARSTPRQLKYHIDVAIGSLAETRYLLGIVRDLGHAPPEAVEPIIATADSLQPRLAAFARAIQDGRSRHDRFS